MSKSKKAPKASSSEEEAIVFGFLEKQNRPFSVQNIVDALQKNGVKKTGTERALASLVSKGSVTQKTYGKIHIFILAQDKLELPDPEESQRVDAEIKALSTEVSELDEKIGELKARAISLGGILSIEEARAEVARLDEVAAEKQQKLNLLGDGTKLVSKEEKREMELKYYRVLSAWKTRKKMVRGVADVIGESSGMKPKEFYEQVGVETDEDAGASIADHPDISNPTKPARGMAGRPAKRRRVSG